MGEPCSHRCMQVFFFTVLSGTPLVSHLYKQKEAREGVGGGWWWVVLGGVEDTPLLPYYKACYGLGLELGPGSDASYIRRRAKSAQILFRRHRIRPVDRTRINTCKSPLYVAGVARGNACGASCCAFMARSKRRTKCHLVRDLSRARACRKSVHVVERGRRPAFCISRSIVHIVGS